MGRPEDGEESLLGRSPGPRRELPAPVGPRAPRGSRPAARRAPLRGGRRPPGARHPLLAAQVARGLGFHRIERRAARPGVEDAAALLPRPRPQVHDVVRRAHDQRLVLDHDQRVPARGQVGEDRDQLARVARVETDGGLVEHVEGVGEVRAQRVRELDPLRLAARERAGQPVERQVAEVDALEETEPRSELGEHRPRDLALGRAELEPGEEARGRGDGHRVHRGDVLPTQADEQRLAPQPRPAAGRAPEGGLVALDDEPVADVVGLLLEPLEERERPPESFVSLEQEPPVGRSEVLPRRVERHAALARELLEPRPGHPAP